MQGMMELVKEKLQKEAKEDGRDFVDPYKFTDEHF
jgi:hypothetical protein